MTTITTEIARELVDSISSYPIYDDESIKILENPTIQKDEDGTYLLDAICRVKTEDFDGTMTYHRSIVAWGFYYYDDGGEGCEPDETFELVKFTNSNGETLTYKRKIAFGKIEYESLA